LLGVAEHLLQRMAQQVLAAQAKQGLRRRIKVGDARLTIQQDDRCGKVFQ